MQTQDDQEQGHSIPPRTLAELFTQESAVPPAPRSRPAVYRSYHAGSCLHCGLALGYIEVEGGRDRHYCNDKCRVAACRSRQHEKKRQQVLQYNSELRDYWQEHEVKGRLLVMLQDILLKHGKQAAKAATDAVLFAQIEHEHRVINLRAALMIDLFELGEEVNYPVLIDVDVDASLEHWSWFADGATVEQLRAAIDNAQRILTAPDRKKRLHSPPASPRA